MLKRKFTILFINKMTPSIVCYIVAFPKSLGEGTLITNNLNSPTLTQPTDKLKKGTSPQQKAFPIKVAQDSINFTGTQKAEGNAPKLTQKAGTAISLAFLTLLAACGGGKPENVNAPTNPGANQPVAGQVDNSRMNPVNPFDAGTPNHTAFQKMVDLQNKFQAEGKSPVLVTSDGQLNKELYAAVSEILANVAPGDGLGAENILNMAEVEHPGNLGYLNREMPGGMLPSEWMHHAQRACNYSLLIGDVARNPNELSGDNIDIGRAQWKFWGNDETRVLAGPVSNDTTGKVITPAICTAGDIALDDDGESPRAMNEQVEASFNSLMNELGAKLRTVRLSELPDSQADKSIIQAGLMTIENEPVNGGYLKDMPLAEYQPTQGGRQIQLTSQNLTSITEAMKPVILDNNMVMATTVNFEHRPEEPAAEAYKQVIRAIIEGDHSDGTHNNTTSGGSPLANTGVIPQRINNDHGSYFDRSVQGLVQDVPFVAVPMTIVETEGVDPHAPHEGSEVEVTWGVFIPLKYIDNANANNGDYTTLNSIITNHIGGEYADLKIDLLPPPLGSNH